VNTYGNLLDIKKEIKGLEYKRKEAETNTREAESKHAHLMTVVGMCKRLLFVLSSVFRPYKTYTT
jgi:hypothetical protein